MKLVYAFERLEQLQLVKGAKPKQAGVAPSSNSLVHRDIQVFYLHSRQIQIARDSGVQGSPL